MDESSAGRKYLITQITAAEVSLGEPVGNDRNEQLAKMPFSALLQEAELAKEALMLAQQNEITKANRLLIAKMLKDDDRRGPLS